MRNTHLGFISAAALGLMLSALSCSSTTDCASFGECAAGGSSGAGGSASGNSNAGAGNGGNGGMGNGGSENGGASAGVSGSNSQGGEAGAAGAAPCNGTCSGSTPVCNPATNTCVECTDESTCAAPTPACDTTSNTCVECTAKADCTDGAKPLCDMATEKCVACLQQSDCTSEAASACVDGSCAACTKDADCSNIAGKNVCDAGTCVQCTGAKFAACGQSAGTPLVCDSLQHTCTTNKQHSAGLCQPCVTDAECNAGEICVLDKFGTPSQDVGYFCHWKQGDTADGTPADCTAGGQPYVGVQKNATSIDGATSDICTLAVSTCTALNQFRAKSCTNPVLPDDSLCGVSPPKDAKCAQFGATTYRCTVTCGSDDDCPSPFTCNRGASPRVCNLN